MDGTYRKLQTKQISVIRPLISQILSIHQHRQQKKKMECTEICVFVRIEKNLSAKRNEVNDYYHNSINAIEMCVHACIYGIDVNVYFVT